MRVWDCFPYWRERWATAVRRQLWWDAWWGEASVRYAPVALVGDRTHRGGPLPDEPMDPGAIPILCTILDADDDWGREEQQRDAVRRLLPQMDPDDLILLTDADEFVDPRALPRILEATESGPVKLRMANYMCGTRYRTSSTWRHPAACRARDLPEHPSRDLRLNFSLPQVHEAGWHLTYYLEADVDAKLRAFAHAECDTAEMREDLARIRKFGTGCVDDPLTGPLAEILAGVPV